MISKIDENGLIALPIKRTRHNADAKQISASLAKEVITRLESRKAIRSKPERYRIIHEALYCALHCEPGTIFHDDEDT